MSFVHLYSLTDGELRPCCIADSFDVKVNLKYGVEPKEITKLKLKV